MTDLNHFRQVATGLWAPEKLTLTFAAAPGVEGVATVMLVDDPSRYLIAELTLRGENIDSEVMRSVVIQGLFDQVPDHLVIMGTAADRYELVNVAQHYMTARLSGKSSREAVCNALGVSPATAGRRIREARKAGHFRPLDSAS